MHSWVSHKLENDEEPGAIMRRTLDENQSTVPVPTGALRGYANRAIQTRISDGRWVSGWMTSDGGDGSSSA